MTRRTKAAYTHLFKKIYRQWKLSPTTIVTDFEPGLRNVLQEVFQNARLLGCWFHFCQAVRRKATSLKGFLQKIRSNTNAQKLYRMFLCLPLMQKESILIAFDYLKVRANDWTTFQRIYRIF